MTFRNILSVILTVKRDAGAAQPGRGSPARAGTRGVPRAVRERQLIDIARDAWAERGYGAVPLEEIAARAGVTKAMVYAYFGSKEGLYVAGIRLAYDDCAERVRAAAAATDTVAARQEAVIRAVLRFVADYRQHWVMIFGAQGLGGAIAAEAARSRADMVALVAELTGELLDDPALEPHLEPVADTMVAAVMAAAARWIEHPEEPLDLHVIRVMSLTWVGLERMLQGELWLPPAG